MPSPPSLERSKHAIVAIGENLNQHQREAGAAARWWQLARRLSGGSKEAGWLSNGWCERGRAQTILTRDNPRRTKAFTARCDRKRRDQKLTEGRRTTLYLLSEFTSSPTAVSAAVSFSSSCGDNDSLVFCFVAVADGPSLHSTVFKCISLCNFESETGCCSLLLFKCIHYCLVSSPFFQCRVKPAIGGENKWYRRANGGLLACAYFEKNSKKTNDNSGSFEGA
ncbi:hypothetical protein LWI29_029439 [Acer saccharum]|uniref:Uncharacterized protein n=1 Tax=Acer saccharum TaxID=4024 RepID=A0AA39RIG1_ACESA|nr:hypothetical protein LWI29_029439 [Acer saccharum]